jgi:endonuclease G, mitochondrial
MILAQPSESLDRVRASACKRIRSASGEIAANAALVDAGRPLEAEDNRTRRTAYVANLLNVDRQVASRIAAFEDPRSLGLHGDKRRLAEAVQGDSVDWLPVAWLDRANQVRRAVSRLLLDGRGIGTGFLISDRLLITNHHVIESASDARAFVAEFDYEMDTADRPRPTTRYALDPDTFFITDAIDDLDYTIVALGPKIDGTASVAELGFSPLGGSEGKHTKGSPVTIIQHPNGGYKLITLRENRIVFRGDNVLHYLADTEPGASGSPVYNDLFQVVALHHWGGPYRQIVDGSDGLLDKNVNEGIRISSIVRELKAHLPRLAEPKARLLEAALATENGVPPLRPVQAAAVVASPQVPATPPTIITLSPMNSLNPSSAYEAAEAAPPPRPDYETRRGYNPRFLGKDALALALPTLPPSLKELAARVAGVGTAGNPYELKYHNFSIAMNARRKLAFFTAVNIDGRSWKNVDRDTGKVKESAEAREPWYREPRINANSQCNDTFYLNQKTKPYFQRGHLVRRLDPTWGPKLMAEWANADTFHFTNCAPQSSGFNDGKSRWAGIEDYVLYTADNLDDRISVFSGPILRHDDPIWRGLRIPRKFFKVVARVEDGKLRVFALLADQSSFVNRIIELTREAAPPAEKYDDWGEAWDELSEFQSSIEEIEKLTSLQFDAKMKAADVNKGGERNVSDFGDIEL